MEHEDLIVSMKGIQKSFGGVHALTDGELTLRKGEVLGLIGENGAGKSTLMKILSGVYQADAGVMLVDGKEVHYHEPRQALHDGICMIYQELNLVQHLSVGDNIFIGRESQKGWKLDRTKDNRRAEELLKELELDVSPNTTVSSLTVAKQQMIEIAKGISYDSKVLIMDEPTAALSINEIKDLFRVIQKLKAKGISIIYISHRLEELFEITDRITVMRDGAFINTFITKESSLPELIRSMVGREVSWEKKKHSNVAADAPVLLEVQGMESHAIKNASFKLRKGEILGIGGLMGAGRTELARLVFGADWRKHGKILKNGEEIQIRTPHDAVKNGIGYISEDTRRWTMLVYIIAGVFAGLAGIFYSATYTSVLPGSGSGMEMNAIAAVVIGGTSLSGGSGTMLGTIIGVFIMAVLKNGLMTIGIQQQWQVFFTGLAVLLAVMLDIYRSVKLKRS